MNKNLFAIPLIASFLFSAALPVLAENNNSNNGRNINVNASINATVNAQIMAAVGACMQSAVDKRDTALIGVINTYNTAITSVLATRRDSLKAAWGLTNKDARQSALKAAWNTFRNSHRQALIAKRTSRQAAWKQFRNDQRACNPRGVAGNNDNEGQGIDAQL